MTQGFFLLVIVVVVVILILQWLLSSARRQEVSPLRRRGSRVPAVVSAVVQRSAESDSGAVEPTDAPAADSWYIECQWTDPRSGSIYTFRSDDLDATTASAYAPGSPIAVLIAPGSPDNYFVEVVAS